MKWVADMGLEPVRPREVDDGLSTLSPSRALAGMGVTSGSGGDAERRREVVAEAVRVRRLPEEQQRTREEWRERLEGAVGAPVTGRSRWMHGGFDPEVAARGARVARA
eukprot:109964-Prymnesium_polylepis.1